MTNEESEKLSEIELEIANLTNDIEAIECQLEVNELNSDGHDEYFLWRNKAITAKTQKYKSLRLKHLKATDLKRKVNVRLIREKNFRREYPSQPVTKHQAFLNAQKDIADKKETEKTKRHRISENINLKIFKEFKRIIRSEFGEEKYMELINNARKEVEFIINVSI